MALRVLLDTNVLYDNKWRNSEPMRTFAKLCKVGLVKCFIPHVVFNEIASQGAVHQAMQIASIKASTKNLIKYTLPPKQHELILRVLANLDEDKDSILKKPANDFCEWCNAISATVLPLAPHHAANVLNAYFLGGSPFKTVKSKEDFPDAFIYETVKDLAGERLLLICNDANLRKSCDALKSNVESFSNIYTFLADPEIASLIVSASKADDEGFIVGFSEAYLSALPEQTWVASIKKQLEAVGSHSEVLRAALVGQLIDELLRTQVESQLIASNSHKGEVLLAAIGNIKFSLPDATYYGDGKFGFTFEAAGTLSLQYYVEEYAIGHLRGKIVKSTHVYKNVEQYQTDFSARITGRATLQVALSSMTSGNVLAKYKLVQLDEIQEILLSDHDFIDD